MLKRKKVHRILTDKIRQMYDVVADIETLLTEMETDFYRVCLFGSARIGPQSLVYQQVEELATALAAKGCDIVTGGGPGLMEAANKGAKKGGKGALSIGLPIELPHETDPNGHLDVKSHHRRFSSRLDEFMRMSHAVIVMPGGIGTLLEFFYTWQLIQVKHINPRPIILYGQDDMWQSLMDWMTRFPLEENLISAKDFDHVQVTSGIDDVLKKLEPSMQNFRRQFQKHRI